MEIHLIWSLTLLREMVFVRILENQVRSHAETVEHSRQSR